MQDAGIIAALLLTTNVAISEIPQEREAAPAGAPGSMGGMGTM